jgi:phosphoribosylaminoimidazole carboxylase PurE protein|tara:strand:+ start:581 stop:1069 length:489 start_codon:yes stop_codon:yes gene_type:complete
VNSRKSKAKVGIIMGSKSDYKIMSDSEKILKKINILFETIIVSAHRTPDRLYNFARTAKNKYQVIIAGAGGAAHLPGMVASLTHLPVIGVPIETKSLKGLDSLLSIIQMPKGIVTATVAINNSTNAGLLAAEILAISDKKIEKNLLKFRKKLTNSIKKNPKK